MNSEIQFHVMLSERGRAGYSGDVSGSHRSVSYLGHLGTWRKWDRKGFTLNVAEANGAKRDYPEGAIGRIWVHPGAAPRPEYEGETPFHATIVLESRDYDHALRVIETALDTGYEASAALDGEVVVEVVFSVHV
jgi:hypothetical protein